MKAKSKKTATRASEKAALVLLSGGQDSGTALFWARRIYRRVHALCFYYGQKHHIEIDCARRLADIATVPMTIVEIPSVFMAQASELTAYSQKGRVVTHPDLPPTFVPGRNLILLSIAAHNAVAYNIDDIIIGANSVDYSGYPDCRQPFLAATQRTIRLAVERPISIRAPLLNLSKAEIWQLAYKLGVLDTIRIITHTDYNGDHTTANDWGYGKEDNPASILRANGYRLAVTRHMIPAARGPVPDASYDTIAH